MGETLWQKSAVEVAAGIREKHFSCSDVMVSVVERIRALNPKLNAIVMDLTDQALAEAAAADRALQQLAEPGPLFGVPVTIKVNVDRRGRRPRTGSPPLPISSPPAIRRLCATCAALAPSSSAAPTRRRFPCV